MKSRIEYKLLNINKNKLILERMRIDRKQAYHDS